MNAVRTISLSLRILVMIPLLTAYAAEPAADAKVGSLSSIFSTESNPGSGTLEYGKVQPTQKLAFGAEGGHYAMGVVFPSNALPEQVAKDLGSRSAVQVIFGTLRNKLTVEVPQFAALTLMTAKLPARARTFPLMLPDPKKGKTKDFGLMLFSEPTTSAEQPDEDKLKRTFFGTSGTVIAQMTGPRKIIEITNRGTKLPFQLQAMRLEIRASLATPFNTEELPLKGTIEVPIYWPEDQRGFALIKQIARESFGSAAAANSPPESGATQKSKKR